MQRRVTGDTLLHELVRNCISADHFNSEIINFSFQDRINFSITQNADGKLPIDVLNPFLTEEEKSRIIPGLFNFTIKQKIKPLHEPVDFIKTAESLNLTIDSSTYTLVKHACELINETRAMMKGKISLTHPDINGMDYKKYRKLEEKIKIIRAKWRYRYNKIFLREATFEWNEKDKALRTSFTSEARDRLYSCSHILHDYDIANCGEMALFACETGYKKNLCVIPYDVEKGDHVINILKNPENGAYVFFDAWSGNVTLNAADLRICRRYLHNNKMYIILPRFNKYYNKLVKDSFYGIEESSCAWLSKQRIKIDNEFLSDLLSPIIMKSLPAEKYLFAKIIRKNLQLALDTSLVEKDKIQSWTETTIKDYFSSDTRYLPLISYLYCKNINIYEKKVIRALGNGANPDEANLDGETTLHFCASNGYANLIKFLLEKGANPDPTLLYNGATPLGAAIKFNHFECAKILLDAKANPDIKMSFKVGIVMTPLQIAILNNFENMVDLLIERGADVSKCVFNTREGLLGFMETLHDANITSRVLTHIAKKNPDNKDEILIATNAVEFAKILGHDTIAFKLKKKEKNYGKDNNSLSHQLFGAKKHNNENIERYTITPRIL